MKYRAFRFKFSHHPILWNDDPNQNVPSGYVKIAIENGHRNSGFSWIFPSKMVIFHSYVSLPEGMFPSLSPENLEP